MPIVGGTKYAIKIIDLNICYGHIDKIVQFAIDSKRIIETFRH